MSFERIQELLRLADAASTAPQVPAKQLDTGEDAEYGTEEQKRRKRQKPLPHKKRETGLKEFCFDTPLRMCVVGASKSGKTEWVIDYLINCPFDQIVWCGPEHSLVQPGLERLDKFYRKKDKDGNLHKFMAKVDCSARVNHDEITRHVDHGFEKGWQTCVVFDDCIMHSKDKKIANLFTAGRHKNASVIEILQRIFAPEARLHRLNCTQFVIFKFSAQNEFRQLAGQICDDKKQKEAIVSRYKDISERKYGCLVIDLDTESTPKWPCRVRDTKLNCFVPEFWRL